MENTERDKFLTEAIGKCWHEFDLECPERYENWDGWMLNYSGHWNVCTKCGEEHIEEVANNLQFDEWAGFGKLWEWGWEQEWWDDFVVNTLPVNHSFVHPNRFADEIYKYLKENINAKIS